MFFQSKLSVTFIAASLFLTAPIASHATMVVPLNLSQMTEQADRIFRGRCLDVTRDLDENQMPATYVRFRVLEGLKGVETGETVFVKQYGVSPRAQPFLHLAEGEKTIVPMKSLSLAPKDYEIGKEYLLFYYPESGLGFTSPVGAGQGLFDVTEDGQGRRRAVNPLNNRFLKELGRQQGREDATGLNEIESTIQALVLQN